MLTVNSDGVEPTPPATEEAPVEEESDDSSGGSLGFLAIAPAWTICGFTKKATLIIKSNKVKQLRFA